MQVTKCGHLTIITINRPEKKNALSLEMTAELGKCLESCAVDRDCIVTAITGTGSYFTSGNDLSNFFNSDQTILFQTLGIKETDVQPGAAGMLKAGRDFFCRFVKTLIDFPKTLVCVVNGPAVGMGATILPLFDFVYMTDNATLWTPFVSLGQVPECCSSYTFPLLMGQARAANILVAGHKVTAAEAATCGLVTEVLRTVELPQLWSRLRHLADSSPPEAITAAKMLMRAHCRDTLHRVNEAECDALVERWSSSEFMGCIGKFFSNKSKL